VRFFFPFIVEQDLSPHFNKVIEDFKRVDLVCWLGAQKIIWRRNMIIKEGLMTAKKDVIGRSYEEPMQLAVDLMEYMTGNCGYREIIKRGNFNQQVLGVISISGLLNNLQLDARFLLSHKEWLDSNFVESMKQTTAWTYETLGKMAVDLVDSFLFDERMLNSCFRKTATETYEQVFDWSKNRNPRNKPELHEEIRKELVAYLNRPATSKL